ncbi:AAA family ATPase [Mesorhizobium koreense]|uniref:AAA family ATPase n=1 Tax=Mesorhizobium koreense TaxID=3074855 RepID=UPI00287BA5FF|nr:AAA family ATPase [Mesorhizobium sp. WR6]
MRLASDYLEARGATLEAFLAAGGEVVADASRIDRSHRREPALVWWFYKPGTADHMIADHGHPFHRVRYLGGDAPALHERRFNQPRDSGVHVYFVRHPEAPWPEIAADPSYGLIISEGETRALAGAEHGLQVISLTGVDCWHRKGERELHPDLAGIEWRGRLVYVAFDSDIATKPRVGQAFDGLAAALKQHGADVYHMRLPAAPDGAKQGLDDYLKRWGVDAFHALRQSPETTPAMSDADLFSPNIRAHEEYSVAELLGRPVAPVEELVPGWIERGIPNFIAGPGGVNKSRLALQWGLCLNAGANVPGAPAGSLTPQKAPLLYCSAEDDANEIARRTQAICGALKLQKPTQGQFVICRGVDTALVVMKESGGVEARPFYFELLERLNAIPGHKVVVLDSAYDFVRFAGHAKIDEDSVNFFIKVVLQSVCDRGNCTLVIPWHPSQAGSERKSMDGWSVAWQNAPRRRLALSAVKDVPDTYELSVVKRNHGAPVDPLRLRYHEGALMPVAALPDDGKLEEARQAVVREAIACAKANVPLNRSRRHSDTVFKKVEEAIGRRPSKNEVNDWLADAVRNGELSCLDGAKGRKAGYYPPSSAHELAREAYGASVKRS